MPWLGGSVELDLAARVGLLDDGPDRGPLLDRALGARRSAGDGGIDHGREEAGLAAEGPIDGLDRDPRLARDLGHGHAAVAVGSKAGVGRLQDGPPLLGDLFRAAGGSIRAFGLDSVRHFMRIALAPNR